MQNEKYYTPNVEDLYIGYEYEQFSHLRGTWNKKILDYNEFISILDEERSDWSEHHIRVPFLTREQIEEEGWENIGGKLLSSAKQEYQLKHCILEYTELNQNVVIKYKNTIRDGSGNFDGYTNLFKGKCPSINEFRRIIKLLGIDGK